MSLITLAQYLRFVMPAETVDWENTVSAGLSSWGALCQTQMGAPVLCHSLVPIPVVSLTTSRLKWGLVPIDIMMTSALILTTVYNMNTYLNKGYYAAQGHSKSSRSVSIKSPYATSYYSG